MPTYRVKPGCFHGRGNRYGPGDLVRLVEEHAAGFLDKLELVPEPVADEPVAEPAVEAEPGAEEGAGEKSAPSEPPKRKRTR